MGTDLDNEYTNSNDEKIPYGSSSTLMSFYANYSLPFIDGLSVIGRYDMLNPGVEDSEDTAYDDSAEDDAAIMMMGLIYHCTDGLTVSPNIVQTTVGSGDPAVNINLSFQIQF